MSKTNPTTPVLGVNLYQADKDSTHRREVSSSHVVHGSAGGSVKT